MKMRREIKAMLGALIFIYCCSFSLGLLSPEGVNFEVQALMAIKNGLEDPHGVLDEWDGNSVDPCSWTMITCSSESLVIGLGTPSQNLSGTLSPSIGNLINLQIILLQNNNITGGIPGEIGRLSKLHTLDLSDNRFTGKIPSNLGYLSNLQYMKLNNNSLSGEIPKSFINLTRISLMDLSFNNLAGAVPLFPSKNLNVRGNPSICTPDANCNRMALMPMSMALNASRDVENSVKTRSHKLALALITTLGCLCLLVLVGIVSFSQCVFSIYSWRINYGDN